MRKLLIVPIFACFILYGPMALAGQEAEDAPESFITPDHDPVKTDREKSRVSDSRAQDQRKSEARAAEIKDGRSDRQDGSDCGRSDCTRNGFDAN